MTTNSLKKVLSLIDKIISKKNTLPILDYIIFRPGEVITTNLSEWLTVKYLDYQGPEILVNFAQLKEIINKIKKDSPMTFSVNENKLFISVCSIVSELTLANIDEYPTPLKFSKVERIDGLYNADIETIIEAKDYTANDPQRPVMNCIYITKDYIISTNANRMLYRSRQHKHFQPPDYLIEKNTIKLFKGEKTIHVNHCYWEKENTENPSENEKPKFLLFETDSWTLYQRIVDSKYPNALSIIPEKINRAFSITANTEQLMLICKSLMNTNKTTNKGTFTVSLYDVDKLDYLSVLAEDIDLNISNKAGVTIKLSYNCPETEITKPIQFCLNLKLLYSYLQHCKEKSTKIQFYGITCYKRKDNSDDIKGDTFIRDANGNKVINKIVYDNYFERGMIFNDEYLLMPMMINS